MIGPGGMASANIFSSDDTYFIVGCAGGSSRMKWLDPVAFKINTSLNAAGYVLCPASGLLPAGCSNFNSVWVPANSVRAFFNTPDSFYDSPGAGLFLVYHVTNGRLDNSNPALADFTYAVPCWRTGITIVGVPTCGDWQANTTYPPGSTITPQNVTLTCTSASWPGACTGPHTWWLINMTSCTSGPTKPSFQVASQYPGVVITSVQLTNTSATGGDAVYTFVPVPGQPVWTPGTDRVWVIRTVSGVTGAPDMFNSPGSSAAQIPGGQGGWANGLAVTAVTANTFTVHLSTCTGSNTRGCTPAGQGDVAPVAQPDGAQTFLGGYNSYAGPQNTNIAFPQWVLNDNNCQWADNWVSPPDGGSVRGSGGVATDFADNVLQSGMTINGGQDSAGNCYLITYNIAQKTYSFISTCTGMVYNTVCNGGSDYQCTGGTWTRTYVGNAYLNTGHFQMGTTMASVPIGINLDGSNIHNAYLGKSGQWTQPTIKYCATATTIGAGNCGYGANNQQTFWYIGTSQMIDSQTAFGTGSPGHANPGVNTFQYSTLNQNDLNSYQGRIMYPFSWFNCRSIFGANNTVNNGYIPNNRPPQCPGFGDASGSAPGPPTPTNPVVCQTNNTCTAPINCVPNGCFKATNPPANLVPSKLVSWDQHISWVMGNQADTAPFCLTNYSTGSELGPWPPIYPWLGEVLCFATDGSRKIYRQGNQYNAHAGLWFAMNVAIGSGSSSGKFWVQVVDWWCTLGGYNWWGTGSWNGAGPSGNNLNLSTTATQQTLCGQPYQPNKNYPLGEYFGVGPSTVVSNRIFKVTTPGLSTPAALPAATWNACAAVGCQITLGSMVATRIGTSNTEGAIILWKLQ
jgi:hypothetical protein